MKARRKMWIWIIVGAVIVIGAAIGYGMPTPGRGVPNYPFLERPDPNPPYAVDRMDMEGSDEIRKWANEMLNKDKTLNDWETKFLTKISNSRLNLTERQGDKVHDMYENFLG